MEQSAVHFLAAVLRPVGLFILLACILLPIRYALKRYLPDGKLKRFLLLPVGEQEPATDGSARGRKKLK